LVYLKRKIDQYLIDWKNDPERKPLIVKGPRQVGKTESISRFGSLNFRNVVYINFVEEPKYKTITSDGYSTDDIIRNISRIDPLKDFTTGETLIFFDELQEFPDISTAMKFFCIDRRFFVVCSGSMLGINYRTIESNSVGYKTDYEMRSMDFEEFLWGKGYDDGFAADLLDHMIKLEAFNDTLLAVCRALFLDYCILGGMPAVVREYVTKGTFQGSLLLQRQLIADYEEDIRKYAQGMDQTRILNVFNQIPVQLAKENKKFQISKVAAGARFKDYRGCVEWLKDAGVVNVCYCLNYPELPLKGNYDEAKHKIYYSDSGMLVAMLDEEAQEDLRTNRNLGVYKGALYENVVAEAFVKSGYGLFYYKRDDSTLEEDFFVRTASRLIPVEVKASSGRSKSLRTLLDSEKYPEIECGIKLTGGNIGCAESIYTFPYFCAFLLKRFISSGALDKSRVIR